MQTKEQELANLRAELARLNAESKRLDDEKNIKLQIIGRKLGNIPRRFSAKHPLVSKLLGATYRTGKELGKNAVQRTAEIGRGIAQADFSEDTSKMNNLQYINYLAKKLSNKPKVKRLAEA